MSQAFIGEIRCFGFPFAPFNWAVCRGQLLPISQYDALYSILGTTFGGDGITTFGLPNLQGRVPMHWGTPASGPAQGLNTVIGQQLGTPSVTLTTGETPQHTHTITAVDVGPGGVVEKTPTPNSQAWLGPSNPDGVWNVGSPLDVSFSPNTLTTTGGSLPHDNMQPYLAVNFGICLVGIYPSRN